MTRRNVFIALGAALALLGTIPAEAQDRRAPEPTRRPTVYRVDESRGWLGISLDWSGGERGPVTVEAVVPESPAARAGVARGDTVLRLDGATATAEAVRRLNPAAGDTVRLRLRRDGREREVRVVAARREEDVVVFRRGDRVTVIHPDSVRARMGIRLDTIGAHLDSLFVRMDSMRVGTEARRLFRTLPMRLDSLVEREMFDGTIPFSLEVGSRALAGAEFTQMNAGLGRYFQTEKGLLALRVAPGSPAAKAGLESGDVVVRANGREVESLRDLREAVTRAEDSTAKLDVLRQGRRRELTLRWERGAERGVRVIRTVPPAPRTPRPVSH
ncbi:MAG TPA: PDZ domain-containing protein [Longimicrobiaceae bacterium]|nr:PDZ domain-containing protein [Longimicrobiaceae bacterium]